MSKFKKGFLWGTGISAFQTEGGNIWNDWYPYYKKYNIEVDGCGGKVTDHYNRYKEDFDLARKLHQNSQRISIEWSRVEKQKGVFDKTEIKHYKEVLNYLKKNNFTVVVTLHHFTNPGWFAKEGGWSNPKSVEYYRDFVELAVNEFGEDIDFWITLNEPYMYAALSNLTGKWAPEEKNFFTFLKAVKNLAKANEAAYRLIHSSKKTAMVGIASNIMPYIPATPLGNPFRVLFDKIINFYFLDKTSDHLDFIGLNYYYPISLLTLFSSKTDLGWPIYPKGIYFAITRTWKRYQKPIVITENGIADEKDLKREKYILDHLAQVKLAMDGGANVLGYFYWSLLDNLELTDGFWPRFGLLEVNYKNHTRIIRKSAITYADICRDNSLSTKTQTPSQ
jgi:beta-glucosidase